jgi:hypothetical protein
MRNRPNYEARRNYEIFILVVCQGETMEAAAKKVGATISREMVRKIIVKTANRIASTTRLTPATMDSIRGGLVAMRAKQTTWRRAAKRSFKVVDGGDL